MATASATFKPNSTNFYDRLGVSQTAKSKEIRKAYLMASLKYHPDKNNANEKSRLAAEEAFKNIGEAYTTLSDPSERRTYDLTISSPPSRTERASTEEPSTDHSFGFSSPSNPWSSNPHNTPFKKHEIFSAVRVWVKELNYFTRDFRFRDSSMKPGWFSGLTGCPYIDFYGKEIKYTSGIDLGLDPEEPEIVKNYCAGLNLPFQSLNGHNQYSMKTDKNHEKYKQDKNYYTVHLKYTVYLNYSLLTDFVLYRPRSYKATGTVEVLMNKRNYEILEQLSKDGKIKMETESNITEASII